eukprot:6889441-Pyramimonas_sp.AAC.1
MPGVHNLATISAENRTGEWEPPSKEPLLLLRFAIRIFKVRLDAGGHFYLEHPWTATSWVQAEMRPCTDSPPA